MTARCAWNHLLDVPESVRHTMGELFRAWDIQDLRLDGALELLLQDADVRARVSQVMRESSNLRRVPAFVAGVEAKHPGVSRNQVFRSVALFLGLSTRHVQRLYYRSIRS